MNVFARRISRLRYTYSTLKFWKKHDHPQRLVALSSCKFSTLATSSSVSSDANDDYNTSVTVLETIKENVFARNFFLSSQKYRKTVMQQNTAHAHVSNEQAMKLLNEDWEHKTDYELVSAVKKLNYNIRFSDEKIYSCLYDNIFSMLHHRHQKMNDKDLMTLIQYLVPFRSFHDSTFYQNFYHQLNLECIKRFMNVSIDNMLLLCDMLYEMMHQRECEYIWHAIRKLGNKPKKLEPHHLVQVMFFLNVCRKPPINMYELEYRLQQCFDELCIHEISIAALGFFKTGSRIRSNDLLRCIILKAKDNLDQMNNVSIGAITKLIRFSMQLTEINTLRMLIDEIIPIEPRLTLMTLNHIAHACTRIALYHEELLDRIIKKLSNELTTVRIKDMERFIFVFTSFNIDSSNEIYHKVIEELRTAWDTRRANDIKRFPYMVSCLIAYLSYVNIYPIDLIERIMMPKYTHRSCHGKYSMLREFFVLECGLKIEVPHYNGHFLNPAIRKCMIENQLLNCRSAESTRANVLLMHVLQTCQEMFNNTSDVILDQPLPHFVIPDIIFCLDEQNQLVPIKDQMSKYEVGEIKLMCQGNLNNNRLIALVVGYHALLIKDTHLPVGLLAAKLRQLAKIGYTPILVSYIEWQKCKTQEEKYDYIKQLLFQNKPSKSTI